MYKEARKPSSDPVQEKLRVNKANWNKTVSSFVNDLIHAKKLMNGWPNKFFNEKSKIQNPIPADPATIIGSLASDFQEIASKGNAIIQEQLEYSKSRRQRQMKQMPLGEAPVKQEEAPPDLSQQLSKGLAAHIDDYLLVAEASNPISRFWSKLLNPGFGLKGEAARIKSYRTSLLNSMVILYKDLKRLQKEIVSSSPESIFAASKLLDKIGSNYFFISSGLKSFQDLLPQGVINTGGPIAPPVKNDAAPPKSEKKLEQVAPKSNEPKITQADKAAQDIVSHHQDFPSPKMEQLFGVAQEFLASPEKDKDVAKILLKVYQGILASICQEKQLPLQYSLANIAALGTKSIATLEENPLQIVAQNIVGKWKHQVSPFDKTSAFRLEVYKVAKEARKVVNQVMDHLEKGFDPEILERQLNELGTHLNQMSNLMNMLNTTIRGGNYQSQFINMLDKGRLGDQYSDLGHKQKSQLEKFVEQKRLREMSKMYGR